MMESIPIILLVGVVMIAVGAFGLLFAFLMKQIEDFIRNKRKTK